jgi:hypothetical protein
LPIKAINHPRSSGVVSLSFALNRDGRGHQWQAPPLGACSPPLALLPMLLLKPVLERLRLPLPSQRTHSLARAPIHQRRRLRFPPPPCNRRRRCRTTPATPLFFSLGSPEAHQARLAAGSRPQSPWEPRLDHTGAPPDPPLLPSFAAVASSSPSSSPASPLNCEH